MKSLLAKKLTLRTPRVQSKFLVLSKNKFRCSIGFGWGIQVAQELGWLEARELVKMSWEVIQHNDRHLSKSSSGDWIVGNGLMVNMLIFALVLEYDSQQYSKMIIKYD